MIGIATVSCVLFSALILYTFYSFCVGCCGIDEGNDDEDEGAENDNRIKDNVEEVT